MTRPSLGKGILRVAALSTMCLLLSCHAKAPQDEAMRAGRSAESFPAADDRYFRDMDGGVQLTEDENRGRNMWIVWTGGNDKMWDTLATTSVGTLDFLKTISSRPGLKAERANRWDYLGLVNEPCYTQPSGPDPKRFGLWLDVRDPKCGPDPFEDETKYPGVKIGARGQTMPAGSFYGYGTGIVGLRLFPNPDFDEAAAKKWDPVRYYDDPSYYNSKDLVRPYRVGMSCGFCHVGPSPIKPPVDPENPKWENLSSSVGAQYFWIERIFAWQAGKYDPNEKFADPSFPVQLFHSSRPGTLDTSLISSDNINNPRTMNALYDLQARMGDAARWGTETLAGGGLNNKQFNDFPRTSAYNGFFHAPGTSQSPRVLKDGADSVGVLGALNRVYLNIGLYSEEWLQHFRPLVGGAKVTPILIATANENSAYWNATQQQTPDMAKFFLRKEVTAPHLLKDAPGGDKFLSHDEKQLDLGKHVFAERCARCHSSKIPTPAAGLDPGGCSGKDYMNCWNKYWAWTKTDDFKSRMWEIVKQPDFLEDNYLSTDQRVPVTLTRTNACSPLATNAIGGNIWDNFSSQTYKDLPSVGSVEVYHPYTGEMKEYVMPAGGRGYTRPPSLISVWSTAPFLLNNSVGHFEASPSVEARMASFNDSIEQMLWPEKRRQDDLLNGKVPGTMDRTTATSYINIPIGFLPDALRALIDWPHRLIPGMLPNAITLGPIPKGTPVSLLANLDLLGEGLTGTAKFERQRQVVNLLIRMSKDFAALPKPATDEQAKQVLANLVPDLYNLSKCPDYVVNRGHYFGTSMFNDEPGLTDEQKRALIEYIKTF